MRFSFIIAALTGILLCLWGGSLSGQGVTISGLIVDAESGDPLVAATVAVVKDASGAYTDEKGRFSFRIDAKGRETVAIRVSLTGYSRLDTLISIQGETRVTLNLPLKVEPLQTEDVVITASKGFQQRQSDVTVSIEVVKPAEINLQASADITAVLNQVPGVDMKDEQINIRGSSGFAFGVGSRVMFMLDGLPLISGETGIAELRLVPVDNVAQVEVVKGSSSVLYGSSALGGAINVITADPTDEPLTSVRLRSSLYSAPRFKDIDWDGPSSAYMSSAHLFHSRRVGNLDLTVQTDFIRDSGYRIGTSRKEFRGILQTKYRPRSISGLTLGLNVSTRLDSSGAFLFWNSYYPDSSYQISGADTLLLVRGGALAPTQNEGGFRRQLLYRVALDPTIKYLTPNGSLFWYRGRFLKAKSNNTSKQSSDNTLFYNDLIYQTTLFDKVSWVSGLTYAYATAESEDLYGDPIVVDGDTLPAGPHYSNSLGVYTQFDAKFGKFNLNLGFRVETVQIDELERETKPLLRAGVNYELTKGTNFRASFGQGFRVPAITERFISTVGGGLIIEPNPNLRAESGYSAELGFRQGFYNSGPKSQFTGYVDIAAFLMRFDDMVEFGIKSFDFASFSAIFSTINIADAKISGVELSLGADLKGKNWRTGISGGVNYINPINLNAVPADLQMNIPENGLIDLFDTTKTDQPEVLKYRNRWLARGSGYIGYKAFTFTTNYRYRSFMETIDQYLYVAIEDLQDFQERHPSGDHVFDFIFGYQLAPRSQLALNVSNVFNEEYMIIPGFLAEQRKFTVQYEIQF